ncbi:MAG: hypothetical protein MAG431_01945 [Chloroflexi bacterium]|nr:hypothetical protein [Chloroflexota bacterium]
MKTTIELPAMYADHHVTEVRRILLNLDGVKDVYASSGFQAVEIDYNSRTIKKDEIVAELEEAGYMGDLLLPVESGEIAYDGATLDTTTFRHTTSPKGTRAVGFAQKVSDEDRAQWPVPGLGLLKNEK